MPAATPNLALPYPVPADTADVPRDIQALATKLDASGAAVAALPASPTDGQECFFLADAANGVVWHLRFRAGKWDYVGGAALMAGPAGAVVIASGTNTPLTGGPTLTLPLPGSYELGMSAVAQLQAQGAGYAGMRAGVSVNGGAPIANVSLTLVNQYNGGLLLLPPVLAANRAGGDVLSIQCASLQGISASFGPGTLRAVPVRVG